MSHAPWSFPPRIVARARRDLALVAVWMVLAGLLAPPVGADNPLKRKTARPFAGTFEGDSITLELSYEGVKTEYTGWLTVEGDRYSCYGSVKDGVLQGTFLEDGEEYAFTARLDGDRLVLESEGDTFTLRRKGDAGPAASDPAPEPRAPVPAEPRAGPAPAGAMGGVGIAFQETEQGWVVAQVQPGSPAARAKVQPGGVLRAVNGESVDGLSLEAIRGKIMGPVGSPVTLVIETEDEVTTVILERAALGGGAGPATPKPGPVAPGPVTPGPVDPTPVAPNPGTEPAAPEGGIGLRPGVRIVWFQSSASIPGTRVHLTPDEDGKWVDPTTGKKYGETDTPGAGGAGYSVLDLVTMSPEKIVLDGSVWSIDMTSGNAPFWADSTGYVGDANGVGDWWVSPRKLAAMEEVRTGPVRVRRMPYPLHGTTWNALRIQTDTGKGWTQYTYDLDSGLLLVHGSNTTTASVWTPGSGGTAHAGAGSTVIVHGHLAAVRKTNLPGPGTTFPEALRNVRRFTFTGQQHVQMQGMGDIQVPPTPITMTFDVVKSDPSYLHVQYRGPQHQQMPMLPPTERIIPPGTVGSFWMDPRYLASLQPQQVLDEDPTLQTRVVVAAVERGPGGGRVVLVRQARTGSQAWAYDLSSGVITAAEHSLQNGLALTTVSVQLTGR